MVNRALQEFKVQGLFFLASLEVYYLTSLDLLQAQKLQWSMMVCCLFKKTRALCMEVTGVMLRTFPVLVNLPWRMCACRASACFSLKTM